MYRRLPIILIILIIFTVSSAHAQQRFFGQFFDSLKNTNAAGDESVDDNTASTAIQSGPLALQPTEMAPRYKKRRHASYRHRQAAPAHQPAVRAESQQAPAEKTQASSAESNVPPEPTQNPEPADENLPSADTNTTPPPEAAWPNSSPPLLEPWPAEPASVDNAQIVQTRDVPSETPREESNWAQPIATAVAQEVDSFLDRQRNVLAGFSMIWLALGLAMFVFRRPLATAIVALQHRRSRLETDMVPSNSPSSDLSLILSNAARDDGVVESIGNVSVANAPALLPDAWDQPETHTPTVVRIA